MNFRRLLFRATAAACLTLPTISTPATASDLLVADYENHRVLRFDGLTGDFVSVFIPNATVPSLDHPGHIVAGPNGDIFVTSGNYNNIVRVSPDTGAYVSALRVVGCGSQPQYMAFGPDGYLYVACPIPGKVIKLDPNVMVPANGDGSSATIGDFVPNGSGGLGDYSGGLTFGPDGRLYVANSFATNSILRYDGTNGSFVDTFVSSVDGANDIEFGADGKFYVLSVYGSVNRYAANGSPLGAFVPSASGGLSMPRHFAFGPGGDLFVSSYGTNVILRYSGGSGSFLGPFTSASAVSPLPYPFGLHFVSTATSCNDVDGDGFGSPGDASCTSPLEDCADTDSSTFPGAAEACDGLDNDCDGQPGADEVDLDGDEFRVCENDCDDAVAAINPDGLELPGNFVDENCDGSLGSCSPCAAWPNHGQYVRCVAHAVESLVEGGSISEAAGDALVTSAAQSSIGKRGFVPSQCQ